MATRGKKFVLKKKNYNTFKNSIINENTKDIIVPKRKKDCDIPTRALFDYFVQVEHIAIEILRNTYMFNNNSTYINFMKCEEHKNIICKYLLIKVLCSV